MMRMIRMIIHRWASQMGASGPPREDVWDVGGLPTSRVFKTLQFQLF